MTQSRCIFVINYSGTQQYHSNDVPSSWLLGFHDNVMPIFIDGNVSHPGDVAFLAPSDGILRSLCINLSFANSQPILQLGEGTFETEVLISEYPDNNMTTHFVPIIKPKQGLHSNLKFNKDIITNRTVLILRDITNEIMIKRGTAVYIKVSLHINAPEGILPFNVHGAMTFELL